jgi:4-hydroxy-tetrahydrodipicolinate synthase
VTFGGTWFVVPTAFGEDGSLDLESQRRVVEAAIDWGVDGLTALGVTSEAAELSGDERTGALEAVVEATGGRVPLVVGCSGATVEAATGLARQAGARGAAGVMVSAPPGARDLDALPEFFGRVAREGGLTLVVQDEPAATGVTMPVDIVLRCVESAGARTVKLEDPPTPPKIARLLSSDPGLRVFGGLGGVSALAELRAGACGTMTGFALPEILGAVREAVEEGDLTSAGSLFERYLPLIRFEAQPSVGLAIRKEVLRRRGVLRTPVTRRGGAPDAATLQRLGEVLDEVGIRPSAERFLPQA